MSYRDKLAAFDDCGREALEIADLRITVRLGGESFYIGLKHNNGAELDREQVKQILPYLRRFVKTGKLLKPKKQT